MPREEIYPRHTSARARVQAAVGLGRLTAAGQAVFDFGRPRPLNSSIPPVKSRFFVAHPLLRLRAEAHAHGSAAGRAAGDAADAAESAVRRVGGRHAGARDCGHDRDLHRRRRRAAEAAAVSGLAARWYASPPTTRRSICATSAFRSRSSRTTRGGRVRSSRSPASGRSPPTSPAPIARSASRCCWRAPITSTCSASGRRSAAPSRCATRFRASRRWR